MSLNSRQYLLRGARWAAAGRIFYAALAFAVSILVAHLLTRRDVGLYFLSISLSSFVAIFARAGMDNVLLRRISESIGSGRPRDVSAVTKRGLLVVAITTLLCVAGYLVIGPRLAPLLFPGSQLNSVTVPTALWIGAFALQMTLTEILRGFKDIRGAALTGGITNSALLLLLLLIVATFGGRSHLSAAAALWLSLAAASVNIFLAAILVLIASRALPRPAVSSVSARKLVGEAWPLLLDSVVLFGLANFGLWVVGSMLSPEQVAIYGMSLRLVTLVSMPTQIANSVLPPLMSHLYSQGRLQELENVVRKTTTLIAALMLLVLLPLALYGGPALAILFGPAYREGGPVVGYLALGQAATVVAGSSGFLLIMTSHQRAAAAISTSATVLYVPIAVIATKYYGAAGAAFAFMCVMIAMKCAQVLVARARVGIWTQLDIRDLSPSNFKNLAWEFIDGKREVHIEPTPSQAHNG